MKMELDKKLDTIRLNVLAANFGDLATRRQMIQEFGDYPDALWGVNENGEKVMLSIRKNGITERVFQSNRWVRVNEYDADGCEAGETYEGRWAECPKPTATDTDEELELSDAQSARNPRRRIRMRNWSFRMPRVPATMKSTTLRMNSARSWRRMTASSGTWRFSENWQTLPPSS